MANKPAREVGAGNNLRNKVRLGLWAVVLLLGLALFASPAMQAQHVVRNLTGTVTDKHREPLRGAVVQVHSEATGSIVSYITDGSGQYSFKRLEGDLDYTVWATWRGHRSEVKKLSLFDSNPAKVINLEISPD